MADNKDLTDKLDTRMDSYKNFCRSIHLDTICALLVGIGIKLVHLRSVKEKVVS